LTRLGVCRPKKKSKRHPQYIRCAKAGGKGWVEWHARVTVKGKTGKSACPFRWPLRGTPASDVWKQCQTGKEVLVHQPIGKMEEKVTGKK